MSETIIGRIEFGNTREGCALKTLQESLLDKAMWMNEAMKHEEEVEELRRENERLSALVEELLCDGGKKRGRKIKR